MLLHQVAKLHVTKHSFVLAVLALEGFEQLVERLFGVVEHLFQQLVIAVWLLLHDLVEGLAVYWHLSLGCLWLV
jgi:hypothetical protein